VVLFFLLIAVFLLFLNGFFVLAEFAAVKIRPSQVQAMVDNGVRGARSVQIVLEHIDEYLSVCQLGITFASIGLGFVAEPAIVKLVEPVLLWTGWVSSGPGQWMTAHGIAFTISYLIVSFLHILLGELVPKSIAIRLTERASLVTANPLRFFRFLFHLPLTVLNGSANFLLSLLGLGGIRHDQEHSEDELRILLDQTQAQGQMSFRRLLFFENVFDLGELRVGDTMRPRSQVRCLDANLSWSENLETARRFRHTRYPLIVNEPENPVGIVHLKDLLLTTESELNLQKFTRPILSVREDLLLEALLAEMQKKRVHAALVRDASGAWIGFLTLEDVIEEIVGTIRDEFEDEEQLILADMLNKDRVQLGIEADSTIEAVRKALALMSAESLPFSKESALRAIEERERVVETYLGRNLGMPHARLKGLKKPVVLVIRSENGIPYRGTRDRANLLIVLLTPAGQPRVHQRLQSMIATLFDESEYIPGRLRTAGTQEEVLEILSTGEQASLD